MKTKRDLIHAVYELQQEGIIIKRLKNILLSINPKSTTYRDMYEGEMLVSTSSGSEVEYSPLYYHENIGFFISRTHKLALDKPTVNVQIPCSLLGIPVSSHIHEIHIADFCFRRFTTYLDELNDALYNRSRPDDENGKYYFISPGGEIVVRNSSYFTMCHKRDYEYGSGITVYPLSGENINYEEMCVCFTLQVQLPKNKLRKAIQMLCRDLPDAVDRFILEFDTAALIRTTELAEKQNLIRAWIKKSDYCAFIENGSILPRYKGSDSPMTDAIPFHSTPEDEIEIHGIRGMGIKRGVTVITGGGYSGKSTLLDAISAGIYDHVLGDGRELCITDESAVTISAEEGRSAKHVNISPFIKWLPGGDVRDFSTDCASGSISQAVNILEAINCGARLLLIDEDRSATNFMIQDKVMKELIPKETITPFTDRVHELHENGVSTILVIGGSGEYLSVANQVYIMEDYKIRNITNTCQELCLSHSILRNLPEKADWTQNRVLYSNRFSSYPEGSGSERLNVSDMGFITIGNERIDIRGLHNIVSPNQLYSLGFMLRYLMISNKDLKIDIATRVDELYIKIKTEGLDFLYSSAFTSLERFLDLPRKQELMALIYRMRKIEWVNIWR